MMTVVVALVALAAMTSPLASVFSVDNDLSADAIDVSDSTELQNAFNTGGNVQLTGDVDIGWFYGTGFRINSGIEVNLDLNGHKITGKSDVTGQYSEKNAGSNAYLIESYGILTISDSTQDAKGAIEITESTNTGGWSNESAVIVSCGTVYFNSGNVINYSVGSQLVILAFDLNSTSTVSTMVMSGGYASSTYAVIRAFTNTQLVDLTITGGEMSSTNRGIWVQHLGRENVPVDLEISGGKISATNYAVRVDFVPNSEITVDISGGEFYTTSNIYPVLGFAVDDPSYANSAKGSVSLSGCFVMTSGSYGKWYDFLDTSGSPISIDPFVTTDIDDSYSISYFGEDNTPNGIAYVQMTAGSDLTVPLNVPSGESLPADKDSITVTVDGASVDFTYDSLNGTITIPNASVAGDVVISVSYIPFEYEVDGNEASVTVTEESANAIASTKDSEGNVAINVPGDGVTALTMDQGSMTNLISSLTDAEVSSVSFGIGEATISLSLADLTSMEGAVQISVSETSDVPDNAKDKVSGGVVYDFSITDANGHVSQFGDKVKVSLRYELAEGQDPNNVKVWYIDADGNLTDMDAVYQDGYAVFYTDHFSLYAVVYEEPTSSPIPWEAVLFAVIVAIVIAGILIWRARKTKA